MHVRASESIHGDVIYLKTEAEDVQIEVALQYANEYTENLHSYVNNIHPPDGGTHVITVLRRKDLEVVSEFAGPGAKPGQLGRPHNLSVDPSGNIFVAEAAGPIMQNPVTGEIQTVPVEGQKVPPCDSRLAQVAAPCQAGYRAQKFTFAGTK